MEEIYGDFRRLPEDCISHVLSLTSPRDSCRSEAVSAAFRSAVDSDALWERFLPSDYQEILDRTVDRIEYSSKRDLFFQLCDPILIDGGRMSFALEKTSGAKCFMLSARNLWIVWGDTPQYWGWISVADYDSHSRFSEVAQLRDVCWLEIHGKINARLLSPKTNYGVYFVYKMDQHSYGLRNPPQETLVILGAHKSVQTVQLQPRNRGMFRRLFYVMPDEEVQEIYVMPDEEVQEIYVMPDEEVQESDDDTNDIGGPCRRGDGWMEVEMGEFYNEEGDAGEVDMSLLEVKGGHWKSGLVVMGIEVRPKMKGN